VKEKKPLRVDEPDDHDAPAQPPMEQADSGATAGAATTGAAPVGGAPTHRPAPTRPQVD
jgi:hypothetical protein